MKTGIELIAIEREEQIEKHHRTIENDVINNTKGQLAKGAASLIHYKLILREPQPEGWDGEIFEYMRMKGYKERLIIAGALIAAEIDRLQNTETKTSNPSKK